jgi:hypothetical protein
VLPQPPLPMPYICRHRFFLSPNTISSTKKIVHNCVLSVQFQFKNPLSPQQNVEAKVKYFSNNTNNNTIEKNNKPEIKSFYVSVRPAKSFPTAKKALSKVNKMINKYKAQKYSETPKRKGKI